MSSAVRTGYVNSAYGQAQGKTPTGWFHKGRGRLAEGRSLMGRTAGRTHREGCPLLASCWVPHRPNPTRR